MQSLSSLQSRHPFLWGLLSGGLLVGLALAVLALAGVFTPSAQPLTDGGLSDNAVWFDDLLNGEAPSQASVEVLTGVVADRLLENGSPPAPAFVKRDNAPRIVFLSISDGQSAAHVLMGRGRGLEQALEDALTQTDTRLQPGYQPRWVKLDVVAEVSLLQDVDLTVSQPAYYERSLYGLAFDRQTGLAFVPEELVARTLLDRDQDVRLDNMAIYLELIADNAAVLEPLEELNPVTVYRFTTVSAFSDGQETLRLYRGHRLFDDLSPDDLLASAAAGGAYLARSVDESGRYVYSYFPKSDREDDDYNILRHAGTSYAMLELYEQTQDPFLLEQAERTLVYLVDAMAPCTLRGGEHLCVVEGGEVKLGGNGLALIALAKYTEVTGDRRYVGTAIELGEWVLAAQAPDGEFTVQLMQHPGGQVTDYVSQYYPGEAILGLNRLYGIDPDERWLDAAEAAAKWLITVRDGDLPIAELAHDHWLLYGLNDLYRTRSDPLYLEHASRIAEAIITSQNRNPAYLDWAGSYYQPPRSTPTATRSEGLYAAYQLAADFGSEQEAERILDAIQRGVRFQLQTQFRPESAMYLADPQRVLGGFHRNLTNYEIRNDYVQHNISALLGLYRIEQGR